MAWFKKLSPILGVIAFLAVALYIIIGVLTALSGPVFSIFSKYSHPIRGLFDICTMIAILPLIAIVYSAITGSIGKEPIFSQNFKIELLIILVTIIGTLNMPLVLFDIGTTQIGDFFEKSVYTEDYYVEINDMKYPATILRTHSTNGSGILYILEELQFGNDSVYFTSPDAVDLMPSWEIDYIVPGVKTVVTTDEGRSFAVTLTTERIK